MGGIAHHRSKTLPGLLRERESWRNNAACKDTDPELFFEKLEQYKAARVCRGCPVRRECLTDVMAMPAYLRNVGQFRAGQWFRSTIGRRPI